MEEAKKIAKAEGVTVNQLVNLALAEKVSALRTREYFAERAARGNLKKALQILTPFDLRIALFASGSVDCEALPPVSGTG